MLARSLALLLAFAVPLSAQAAGRRVVFVDNRVPPGGAGGIHQPFATIDQAMRSAGDFDVIFVAETDQPYLASVNLRRGQMLIGSAYGLEAIRAEMKVEFDAPVVPAAQGPGPLIQGSVTMAGDNVLAGVTIATAAPAAISAASPGGPISILGTYIRTSGGANGIAISGCDFPVTVTGGGVTATGGAGISLYGGRGEAVFERFGLDGSFTNALDIRQRMAPTTFRGKAVIDVTDAIQPAVTIADCTGRVDIEIPLRVTGRARGISITRSSAKINGDGSRVTTTGAPALEIRDSAVEAAFANVSATGGDRGIIVDKLHGSLAIAGGAIRDTRIYGITVTQSANVRLSNMTITDAGSGDRTKCDDAVEEKTNLRCGAAIHLRHLARSEFENITVTGGKQNGLNANNLEDVTFGGLQIHGAGDEPGETAVLLDEARGTVKFNRCVFDDAAGGAVLIAQQFNSAKIVFERCAFAAAARPTGASHLIILRSSATARLEVEIRNAEIHDNAASALRAEAGGTSSISLAIVDARIERLGRTAIEVVARDRAQARLLLRGTTIFTPGNDALPAVDIATSGAASACADFTGNQIITGGAVPSIRQSPAVGACH